MIKRTILFLGTVVALVGLAALAVLLTIGLALTGHIVVRQNVQQDYVNVLADNDPSNVLFQMKKGDPQVSYSLSLVK